MEMSNNEENNQRRIDLNLADMIPLFTPNMTRI